MITQAELIQVVKKNIHLFQQDQYIGPILSFQRKHIWQTTYSQNQQQSLQKTPNSLKQQQSAKQTNQFINNSLHQSVNENHIIDPTQKLHQKITHKRRHKIFSLPSHSPKQRHFHNEQTKTIRPSPRTNTSSLSKYYQQNQCFNSNIQKVNIDSSLKVHFQPNMKNNNKKLQLFSNDYLPSPSQLNAILKSISNQSRYVPDESIQSRKSLRNKRQRTNIRYHETINYDPPINATKKFVHPPIEVMHPDRTQISKIKFNYVDSKYYLKI